MDYPEDPSVTEQRDEWAAAKDAEIANQTEDRLEEL